MIACLVGAPLHFCMVVTYEVYIAESALVGLGFLHSGARNDATSYLSPAVYVHATVLPYLPSSDLAFSRDTAST